MTPLSPAPAARRPRRGATLVELMVAMMILTVGLFSVLTTSRGVASTLGGGMRQTVAAGIAQARLDSLTSIGCQQLTSGGSLTSGTASRRGVQETWNVTDGFNTKAISVVITIPGRAIPLRYETIIACRD